jgi:hypothetical protein
MAGHGILDRPTNFLKGVTFCEDGIPQGFGFIAAFRRLLYDKDDFAAHGFTLCISYILFI